MLPPYIPQPGHRTTTGSLLRRPRRHIAAAPVAYFLSGAYSCSSLQLAMVLVHGRVEDAMQLVFNSPMTASATSVVLRRGPLAEQMVTDLDGPLDPAILALAEFFADPLDPSERRQSRPGPEPGQATGRQHRGTPDLE